MEDGDMPGALASELLRQNYAFVASFSVILWDCLITFSQEVKYVRQCPLKMRRYLFLFFRYGTVGYFIVCSIFGTQWTLQMATSRDSCRKWFLIHIAFLCLLCLSGQLIVIRKVFNLYERSMLLASGLFTLHFVQMVGILVMSVYISRSLNFDPICNGHDVPGIVLAELVSITCTQGITWVLILRKVWKVRPGFFSAWRRYLRTSEAHAKMSWGLCLVAIVCNSSHSFAHRRVAPVYIFIFPMVVVSIGACRYILRVEKDRDTRSKLAKAIDANESRVKQTVLEQQSPSTGLHKPMHNQPQNLYPPRPPGEMSWPLSDPDTLSVQTSDSQTGPGHNLDTVISNFPYLHGARSYYRLNRNRTGIPNIGIISPNHSPQSSSDWASQRTASIRMSHSRGSEAEVGSVFQATCAGDSANGNKLTDELEEVQSVSSIEIGSLQSSSSVNSEELRQFYNDTGKVTDPFMMGGP